MNEKYAQILKKINTSISSLSKEIEECWTQKNVLVIEKDIMDVLYAHVKELTPPEIQALMKKAFRDTLNLHSRDAIFFLNKKLVVKKFIHKEKIKKDCNTRFGSIPAEELEKLIVKYFPEDIWERVYTELENLVTSSLDFRSITNKYFMDNYIKLFQKIFLKIVIEQAKDEEKEVINGLANFLLRKYFDDMLFVLAEELTKLASNKEGSAEAFLRYYNGDTIFDDEKRPFIKPQIIDAKNKVWHPSAIMSMTLQHFQQLKKIQFQEEKYSPYKKEFEEHEQERKNLEVQIKNLLIVKETFEKNSQEFIKEVKANKIELDGLREEAKALGTNVPLEISDKINILSIMYKNSYKKEEKMFDERKDMEKKMTNLNTRIVSHKAEHKAMELKMESVKEMLETYKEELAPINTKYDVAMHALAKTLSKKLISGKFVNNNT